MEICCNSNYVLPVMLDFPTIEMYIYIHYGGGEKMNAGKIKDT